MRASCPRCRTSLDGGPVVYRCAHCLRAVWAAELDIEYHARPAPAASPA